MTQHRNHFGTIDNLMKEIFKDVPQSLSRTVREEVLYYPPVNIINKKEAFVLDLLVPGYSKEDFKVKLEDNTLTVSAETKDNSPAEGEAFIRKEFSAKAFKRSFNIDHKIDNGAITAKYENGILKLTLPKKVEETSTQEINVL